MRHQGSGSTLAPSKSQPAWRRQRPMTISRTCTGSKQKLRWIDCAFPRQSQNRLLTSALLLSALEPVQRFTGSCIVEFQNHLSYTGVTRCGGDCRKCTAHSITVPLLSRSGANQRGHAGQCTEIRLSQECGHFDVVTRAANFDPCREMTASDIRGRWIGSKHVDDVWNSGERTRVHVSLVR